MKVNIGGQKARKRGPFQNWTIVDMMDGAEVQIDVMKSPLPFADSSVDAIYTSHTLEHIFPDRLGLVLKECRRVLKPKCQIRIVVPDIDKAIRAYVDKDLSFLRDKRNPHKMPWLPDDPLCFLSSWFFTYKIGEGFQRGSGGHVMSFSTSLLEHYLIESGFKDVRISAYEEGSEVFSGCDFLRYKDCSIYMEASK